MNIAGKGVLLIIAVITVGIIVLNQGFDKNTSATSEPVPSPQESGNTEKKSQEIEQQTEITENSVKKWIYFILEKKVQDLFFGMRKDGLYFKN